MFHYFTSHRCQIYRSVVRTISFVTFVINWNSDCIFPILMCYLLRGWNDASNYEIIVSASSLIISAAMFSVPIDFRYFSLARRILRYLTVILDSFFVSSSIILCVKHLHDPTYHKCRWEVKLLEVKELKFFIIYI